MFHGDPIHKGKSRRHERNTVFPTYDTSCFLLLLLLKETATEGLNDIYELRP